MSIVSRRPSSIKARSAWPTNPAKEPAQIDEAELEYLDSLNRVGYAGDCPVSAYDITPSTTAAEWCRNQSSWQRNLHESFDPLGTHRLVAAEFDRIARTLDGQDGAGVLGYVPQYVPVPEPADYACNELAREIVTQVALLYPYDSAVRRIAARAITRLADTVKFVGSANAREFLRDEATFRADAIDAMMEAE